MKQLLRARAMTCFFIAMLLFACFAWFACFACFACLRVWTCKELFSTTGGEKRALFSVFFLNLATLTALFHFRFTFGVLYDLTAAISSSVAVNVSLGSSIERFYLAKIFELLSATDALSDICSFFLA